MNIARIIGIILMIGGFILTVLSILMLKRNDWVFHHQMRLIEEDIQRIKDGKWMTYREMMNKWWVWDIEKLRKAKK